MKLIENRKKRNTKCGVSTAKQTKINTIKHEIWKEKQTTIIALKGAKPPPSPKPFIGNRWKIV
jgi:hypothetical protein